MILTDEQLKEFEAVTEPLMEWLNRNCHPHVKVIVTPVHAELLEGLATHGTEKFVRG